MEAEIQLAKITTILSIALITVLSLLAISLFKAYKLKEENKRLNK